MNENDANAWKTKTCADCKFRIGFDCHRFPPQILHSIRQDFVNAYYPRYPLVVQAGHHDETQNGKFIKACSEHKTEGS